MSHYKVAVFTEPGQSVEDLLAPFDEHIQVEPYVYKTKADLVKEFRDSVDELKKDMCDHVNGQFEGNVYWLDDNKRTISERWQERLDIVEKDDEAVYNFVREKDDYDDDTDYDADGNMLSTYNPKSKWDWYSLGGRFGGELKTKSGIKTDSEQVKLLDFSVNPKEAEDATRFWEVAVEHQPLKDGESKDDFNTFYKEDYYTNTYKTKENYVKCTTECLTYAVLTPDGEWHEPGKMGWWGCSLAEAEDTLSFKLNYRKNFIDSANPEWTMTIVDCHI